MGNSDALRLPVVSLGAEHLVIGHLMRRNVLAYKAPPNNEGYDLICIHPNPREKVEPLRIQVKSRYQTDSDRAFPVKAKTFPAFDYLVVAFLNIGYFSRKRPTIEGLRDPELFTLSREFIQKNHRLVASGWEKVHTRNLDLAAFKNEKGWDIIAKRLGIPYPSRGTVEPRVATYRAAPGR